MVSFAYFYTSLRSGPWEGGGAFKGLVEEMYSCVIIPLYSEGEEISMRMVCLNIPLGGRADMASRIKSYSSCNTNEIEAHQQADESWR